MKQPAGIALFAAALCFGPVLADDAPTKSVATESESAATQPEIIGDIAAGKKLYRRNCRACHGATAMGASSYPKLVGHPQAYLIDKIERYRAGEKFGPNTPLMAQRVAKLDDEDIANVTAFIVSIEEN